MAIIVCAKREKLGWEIERGRETSTILMSLLLLFLIEKKTALLVFNEAPHWQLRNALISWDKEGKSRKVRNPKRKYITWKPDTFWHSLNSIQLYSIYSSLNLTYWFFKILKLFLEIQTNLLFYYLNIYKYVYVYKLFR